MSHDEHEPPSGDPEPDVRTPSAPEEEGDQPQLEPDAEPAPEPADAADAVPEDNGNDDNGDEEEDTDGEDGDEPEGDQALPLASVVEAILFAAREPLKPAQIARAVGKRTRQDAVRAAVEELNVQYLETGRAFEIAEISERYQLMSRPEYARHIMRIYPKRELQTDKDKTHRLTPAALDTLAIVAYKQPVMRSEIERIRGVACGPVLKMLIERGSVRQIGRRTDLVGKPAVFGTTEAFLAEFGLGCLDELPLRNDYLPPPDEVAQVELLPDVDADAPDTAEPSPESEAESEKTTPADAPPEDVPAEESPDGPPPADDVPATEPEPD